MGDSDVVGQEIPLPLREEFPESRPGAALATELLGELRPVRHVLLVEEVRARLVDADCVNFGIPRSPLEGIDGLDVGVESRGRKRVPVFLGRRVNEDEPRSGRSAHAGDEQGQ